MSVALVSGRFITHIFWFYATSFLFYWLNCTISWAILYCPYVHSVPFTISNSLLADQTRLINYEAWSTVRISTPIHIWWQKKTKEDIILKSYSGLIHIYFTCSSKRFILQTSIMNRKSEIAMNDGCIFFGFKLQEINHIAFQLTTGHDKIIILGFFKYYLLFNATSKCLHAKRLLVKLLHLFHCICFKSTWP